jgi:hypothetical protein
LLLEMQLLRDEKVGVRLTSLIPPHLCTYPKQINVRKYRRGNQK